MSEFCEVPCGSPNLSQRPEWQETSFRSIMTLPTPPERLNLMDDYFVHTEGVTGSIPVAPTMKSSTSPESASFPSSSTNLAELLARVEAATGPDAEIEARLHHALFPDAEVLLDPGDVRTRRPGRRGPLREVSLEGWEDFEGLARHFGAERYSASIDAAVALVEKVLPDFANSHGELIWTHGLQHERCWTCRMRWYRSTGQGTTAPLAILAALLRALPSAVHPQGS